MAIVLTKAALALGASIVLVQAPSNPDRDWSTKKITPFADLVVGDIKLSSCYLSEQYSLTLDRMAVGIFCQASNVSSFRQARTVDFEFSVKHEATQSAWFTAAVAGITLPAQGTGVAVPAYNGVVYWDHNSGEDPDLKDIVVKATVRSSVVYSAKPLKVQEGASPGAK